MLYNFRVRYITIKGTKYAIGYLVLCYYEEDTPVFGRIKDIILQPNKEDSLLILTPYLTNRYNRHFSAYEVTETNGSFIYYQHELQIITLCIYQKYSVYHHLCLQEHNTCF